MNKTLYSEDEKKASQFKFADSGLFNKSGRTDLQVSLKPKNKLIAFQGNFDILMFDKPITELETQVMLSDRSVVLEGNAYYTMLIR